MSYNRHYRSREELERFLIEQSLTDNIGPQARFTYDQTRALKET